MPKGDPCSEGARNNQFCSERANKCTCGNRYRSPCKSQAKSWEGDWKYPKLVGKKVQKWGYQAHHTLCVASVTSQITTAEEISAIVASTKWCVNEEPNMLALPVWPMTIDWYVNVSGSGETKPKAASEAETPSFAGLAQHDYDHAEYNTRINRELEKARRKVKAKKKQHEEAAGTLIAQLNRLRGDFKEKLQGRDTHDAWFKGMDGDATWYKAFSMVGAAGSARAFPAPVNEHFKFTFEKLIEAYSRL